MRLVAVLVIIPAWLARRDIINDSHPKIDTRREDLRQLARKLPPPGTGIDRGRLRLEPLPVFDRKGRAFNTAFLAAEQLTDADVRPAYDLILSGPLLDCLLWTGPKNPMAPSALSATAGKDFSKQSEDALACRYVVVYRTPAPMGNVSCTSRPTCVPWH